HNVSAYYAGGAFAAATSNTLTVTQVGTTTSTTALTVNISPATVGRSVTLTATVTPASPVPTRTVAFQDGSTTLGTATLNASGVAALSTSFTTTGTHNLSAVYGGDNTYKTSTGTVNETVNANASLTIASSRALAVPTATPTYTATVSGFS